MESQIDSKGIAPRRKLLQKLTCCLVRRIISPARKGSYGSPSTCSAGTFPFCAAIVFVANTGIYKFQDCFTCPVKAEHTIFYPFGMMRVCAHAPLSSCCQMRSTKTLKTFFRARNPRPTTPEGTPAVLAYRASFTAKIYLQPILKAL